MQLVFLELGRVTTTIAVSRFSCVSKRFHVLWVDLGNGGIIQQKRLLSLARLLAPRVEHLAAAPASRPTEVLGAHVHASKRHCQTHGEWRFSNASAPDESDGVQLASGEEKRHGIIGQRRVK